jgi:hypothetical protein
MLPPTRLAASRAPRFAHRLVLRTPPRIVTRSRAAPAVRLPTPQQGCWHGRNPPRRATHPAGRARSQRRGLGNLELFGAGLERGNRKFVADYMSIAVERLLWAVGDHRTAALLGKFGRLHVPINELMPSAVDAEILGAATLAEIEAEAAQLGVDTAAAIAITALDRILAAADERHDNRDGADN